MWIFHQNSPKLKTSTQQRAWLPGPDNSLKIEKTTLLWQPIISLLQFSSVAQSCPTLCDPINHQASRSPPKLTSMSWWCHPTSSSSVVPFSSCPQSFPASRSFPMSQLFASGGQSIGVSASASVLPLNTQDWSPYLNSYWCAHPAVFWLIKKEDMTLGKSCLQLTESLFFEASRVQNCISAM